MPAPNPHFLGPNPLAGNAPPTAEFIPIPAEDFAEWGNPWNLLGNIEAAVESMKGEHWDSGIPGQPSPTFPGGSADTDPWEPIGNPVPGPWSSPTFPGRWGVDPGHDGEPEPAAPVDPPKTVEGGAMTLLGLANAVSPGALLPIGDEEITIEETRVPSTWSRFLDWLNGDSEYERKLPERIRVARAFLLRSAPKLFENLPRTRIVPKRTQNPLVMGWSNTGVVAITNDVLTQTFLTPNYSSPWPTFGFVGEISINEELLADEPIAGVSTNPSAREAMIVETVAHEYFHLHTGLASYMLGEPTAFGEEWGAAYMYENAP